jgi:hypothetical protein
MSFQERVTIFFLSKPLAKTIVFGVSVILSGVLCSAFVAEITTKEGLIWGDFYKKWTFWFIVLYLIIVFYYNVFIYRAEKSVEKFMDANYSKAYIIRSCMQDIVEKAKVEVNSTKGIKGAEHLMEFLNKFGHEG